MNPYLPCVVAVVAAFTAAAIGAYMRPARRTARKLRREQELTRRVWAARFENVRLTVEGQMAIYGEEDVWLRLLADHPELYNNQPSGGA